MNSSESWFVSASGQAAATWISAGLSLAAIVIALGVAILEQKRANAERIREMRRESENQERRAAERDNERIKFVLVCVEVLEQAISNLEHEVQKVPNDPRQYVSWTRLEGGPRSIYPNLQSIVALQSAARGNAALIMELGRAIRTLEEVCQPIVGDSAPSGVKVHRFAGKWLEELRRSLAVVKDLV